MLSFGEAEMSGEEIAAYLMAPWKFAAVATLRRDGSPIVSPYGFWYDGEHVYLSTSPGRGLAKRLRRDPRISVTIFDEEPLHAFVTIVGTVVEIDDPGHEISLRIHHRYPKPGIEDQDAYDRDWLAPGRVVFRVDASDHTSMNQRKVTDQRLLAMTTREAERLGRGPTQYR